MKKYLMTLATVLCCAGAPIQNVLAQQLPEGVNIKFESKGYNTKKLYSKYMIPDIDYSGEDLRAGCICYDYEISGSSSTIVYEGITPPPLAIPDDPNIYFNYTDPYGRKHNIVNSEAITEMFSVLAYTDAYIRKADLGLFISRGGQYVIETTIPCLNYSNKDSIEITDEPSVRIEIDGNEEGSDQLTVNALFNTGYPYDASQFTGNERAEIRLYALSNDGKNNTIETEVASADKILRLNRTDEPLVATIDTLRLTYPTPKVGLYVLEVKSDWDFDQANCKDFFIIVNGKQLPEGIEVNIEPKGYQTTHRYNDFMLPKVTYSGEDIKTGTIVNSYEITATMQNKVVPAIPDNTNIYIVYTDPYRRMDILSDSTSLYSMFSDLEFTSEYKSILQFGFNVPRGGQYSVGTFIPCLNYQKPSTFEATDEPSVRLELIQMDENGSLWTIEALFNTGYPYDANQFTGSEKAEMRLYALSKDEKGEVVETEVASADNTLRLNRTDEPLVAAIDTLRLTNIALKDGDYVLKMTSDWDFDQANRDDRTFTVNGGRITAIRNLKADSAAKNDEWYDLQGRKFTKKPAAKGMYIINGKAVIAD